MEKERDLIMNHRSSSIAGINALKGFAILAITFFHLFPAQLTGGWLGVCLFFVLSGFLLALSSERKTADGTYTVRAFYKSRIIRIYPSLLLVLILTKPSKAHGFNRGTNKYQNIYFNSLRDMKR